MCGDLSYYGGLDQVDAEGAQTVIHIHTMVCVYASGCHVKRQCNCQCPRPRHSTVSDCCAL